MVVLGAARSGLAAAALLNRHGARVLVSEAASENLKSDAARRLRSLGIESEFGGHTERIFQADGWVISPGIPLDGPVVREARKRGIPVIGELELAFRFCRAPVVAVTGSNGKSTVTDLIGHLFAVHGVSVKVAGNIGDSFAEHAESLDESKVAVVEVSSFQLETIDRFRPRVAVFLNLTPDHLDRHGSMETYGKLKARIFENQTASDALVYNILDARVVQLTSMSRGWRIPFGRCVEGHICGYERDGHLKIRDVAQKEHDVIAVNEMTLAGEHNRLNSLAAALAVHTMGVDIASIREGLMTYRSLPHRLEKIRTVRGVEWINDSKATNVDAVYYALSGFEKPVILIAGGKDKQSDFTLLSRRIREKVKKIILIGESAEKMEKAWRGLVPLTRAESLEQAVHLAAEASKEGDIVLFSPACASFDMFENFEDRGNQFRDLVERLS